MIPVASTQQLRALVTRPREEAEALAVALGARGVEAVIEPLIEIRYRDVAALDLARVQAVLCTSANGVRALARVSAERGLPLLAVGEATAGRARAEGFAAVASAGGDVADLVRLVATRLQPQDGSLLHVAGRVVAGNLLGALRSRGFSVERQILYDARPAAALSPAATQALCSGTIDFALFFSPRTAALFTKLAVLSGTAEACRRITALSISRAADAALDELCWRNRRVAERPNQLALLDALDGILTEHRCGRTAGPADREEAQ